MDCSLPGSSAHGIVQARVLEWVAIAFSWHITGAQYLLQGNEQKKALEGISEEVKSSS